MRDGTEVQVTSDDEADEAAVRSNAASGRALSKLLILFVCTMVVVCQLAAASLTQVVEVTLGFNNPYFLNYVSTSFLLLCHIVQMCLFAVRRSQGLVSETNWVKGYTAFMEEATRIPLLRLALYALPLTFLWFCANYLFAIALSMTNIASSMSLEQSTTIFVFIFSVFLLKEKATWLKLLGVGVCILGVVYIAVGDQLADESGEGLTEGSALLGDALVVASAIAASTYMVLYTKLLRNLPLAIPAVNALLGCIGIWNVILFWPGLIVLSVTGVEDYRNLTWEIATTIVISALLAFAFNYFLNYGMILTSPLVMRVVIVLGVPSSFVVNAILYGLGDFGWSPVLRTTGAALIIAGFSLFSLNGFVDNLKERDEAAFQQPSPQ